MRRYESLTANSIEFVASVGKINRAQLTGIVDRLAEHGMVEDVLSRVMFCPLTAGDSTTDVVERLATDYGVHVSCDSGGYESQISDEYSMRDIYQFDRDYYLQHDWPSEYVLPDQVPVGEDDEETIEHKVQDTISLSRILYRELPPEKQRRSVPVVQGHTRDQVVDCLDAYRELENIQKIGFGSFGTGGVNGGVNYLNEENIELLQFVVKEAKKYDLDVHAFGIGGPTSIPILSECGVDTFDSTGWIRSAGYGNVLFPFKSRLNITHLRDRSGPTVFREQLDDLKSETNHECPFCESFETLHENREDRVLHNLVVMSEMADVISDYSITELIKMMNPNSKYTGYLEKLAAV
jgi:queuine/archaeosine tRNA-ribosyltransferase